MASMTDAQLNDIRVRWAVLLDRALNERIVPVGYREVRDVMDLLAEGDRLRLELAIVRSSLDACREGSR